MTMRRSERSARQVQRIAKAKATAEARTAAHAALDAEACRKWRCTVHDDAHVLLRHPCRRPFGCQIHAKPFVLPRRQRRRPGRGPAARRGVFSRPSGPVRPPGRGR